MIKEFLNNIFNYKQQNDYNFILPKTSNNIDEKNFEEDDSIKVTNSLEDNLEYLKSKYNMLINSDIKARDFIIPLKNKKIPAFLFYIDGMTQDDAINDFILKPLLLRNSIKMQEFSRTYIDPEKKQSVKINLEKFLYTSLIPQNSVSKETEFKEIISKVNAGFCALFVDNLSTVFCIETKGYKGRSVAEPITETVVKGSHEAFVEDLRTNTSMLRKIINNESLVIEETSVGLISKTKVAICYLKNIANDDLVAEAKYRINNLDIDYLVSSGQLEQFIKDNSFTAFPQTISTERPDKTCNHLLNGRVAILINGSPFSIILPAVFTDFLTSPEDFNLNYHYANFLKVLRCVALVCALLLPGIYIAITMYHYELIPSELLFAIISSRKAIPFPIIFEIIIMEASFELIQEASIRVPSSFSTTVGIIGALILGDAAVAANIVSPILIIIVAFTGISAYAIPDNSLRFSIRMFRFMYIILGYIAGFLGIALGFFIHFLLLSNQSSFGVPYFSPYIPFSNLKNSEDLYIKPVWKREKRSSDLNTKKPSIEEHISMKWRQNGKQ
jgi:spore germination protein KA